MSSIHIVSSEGGWGWGKKQFYLNAKVKKTETVTVAKYPCSFLIPS